MNIPVYTAVDNEPNFVKSAVALLRSIKKNSPNVFCDHVCLHHGITSENKKILEEAGWNLRLAKQVPDSIVTGTVPTHSAWTKMLVPLHANKPYALYLDADCLVLDSLEKIDLLPKAMRFKTTAMAVEGLHKNYFNVGVVLFNVFLWRRNNLTKKALRRGKFVCWHCPADQTVMNDILETDEILTLPPKYNWTPGEYNLENPRIVHFRGPKPWNHMEENEALNYLRNDRFIEYCLIWETYDGISREDVGQAEEEHQ